MIKTIGKLGGALLVALLLGAGPATLPATEPTFASDAFELGSADFAARQAATMRLWWAGDSAEPALRDAAESINPEAAARAAMLLRNIDDGITPSTSPALIAFLRQYQSADNFDRARLATTMQSFGTEGARVLLELDRHEKDARVREDLDRTLANSPRMPAAVLLSQGRRDEAEAILAESAGLGIVPAQQFVGYWHVQPDSPQETAALGQVSIHRISWTQAMLEAAAGDSADAIRDAQTTGSRELQYRLTAQAGEWAQLEQELSQPPIGSDLHDCELRALAADLAGRASAADEQARQFATCPAGTGVGEEGMRRAVAFCLIGRPDDAAQLLARGNDVPWAMDLLQQQLHYTQELSLLNTAKGGGRFEGAVEVRGAMVLAMLGRKTAAEELLREAETSNRDMHDPETAELLCQAARQSGQPGKVDEMLLEATRNGAPEPSLFREAGFADPVEAETWWQFLIGRNPDAPREQALHTLRAIAAGHVNAGELAHFDEEFDAWSAAMPTPSREAVLRAEAAAWTWNGHADRALALLAQDCDEFPSSPAFMALGDCAERQQDWRAVADAEENSVHYDPTYASAMFLHGWALTKLGDSPQGRASMDLAHAVPCGDEFQRTMLFDLARARGLGADAEREREALLATGDFNSPAMIPILQISAEDAEQNHHYAAAVRYRQQMLWALAYSQAQVRNLAAFVRLAADVHRLRAMQRFAENQPDRALAEAKVWYAIDPNNSTGLIAIVRAADASGSAPQADELFNTSIAQFTKLLQDFPDSPDLHNQIAWEESRCRRDLDDALVHAQRGVQLDPQNAAILDTLAEVHYQRKEFQAAIDATNRCKILDPADPRFDQQLARFQLALKTGVVDDQ